MTTTNRLDLAADNPAVVISAGGLLAQFNDAGVLEPLDVLAATTIARLFGETDQQVILAVAMTVRGTRTGHVCVQLDSLRDAIVVDGQDPGVLDALPWPEAEAWLEAVRNSALVGDGSADQPLVISGQLVYLERYFRYEQQVAALITVRCQTDRRTLSQQTQDMLDTLLGPEGETQTRQRSAAAVALSTNISVIAGGPGTGKTHTIGALLAGLAADPAGHFPLVALCAPTGKAAARLGEALGELAENIDDGSIQATLTGIVPSTIHRLLGWHHGRSQFAHNTGNRLPHDLVIVDEMSMVSLPMAAKLLGAMRDDAALVLVGDPFQLESIEAGTVLADIVGPADQPAGPSEAETAPTIGDHVVLLDRVHRFKSDSAIAGFSEAVRDGDSQRAVDLLGGGDDHLRWVPGRSDPAFAGLWETLVTHRRSLVELARQPGEGAATLDALSQIAVLCAHHQGADSVWRWGRDLERELDEAFPGLRWDSPWYAGRPVMITRNDYNLDLYNGDIGVAAETDDGLRVLFDRAGLGAFTPSQLSEASTVHAMTIHKSQGSQFDEVVVVLPGEASRLLTRQLLYTAVTRAKKRVWVVGGETVVREAVGRSVQRASGLGQRLWGSA